MGKDGNCFQKGDEPSIVLVYDLLVVMSDCFAKMESTEWRRRTTCNRVLE
jgi:hypothetical protein